jgi:hypothetical protein
MNRDRQQDDDQDDENTVDPDVLKPTCEGFGPPPAVTDAEEDPSSEERTR